MALPTDLTTSDWVDYIETLGTRDDRIVALATFHRRIWNEARAEVLDKLQAADEANHIIVREAAEKEKKSLQIIPDYSDEPRPVPDQAPPLPVQDVAPPLPVPVLQVGNIPRGGK